MMREKLYSYSAIFNTPDGIINAADKTAEKGYKKFDVHSPYPLHGMNSAMKLPPSKLGYVALVFGLSGAIGAILLIYYMAVYDYPVVIGGKPYFAFPAYIPVTFEVTVLTAAIATVLAMLFVFFKLPNNAHPLHDTDYMRKVSSDKYGLTISADDPKFNEEEVKAFLISLNAEEIFPIYWDEEEVSTEHKILEPKFLGFLAVTFVGIAAVTYFTLNILLFLPPFDWMMDQPKVVPQERSTFFADGKGMRKPVEGTISRGFLPYPYANEPELAAENLINPFPATEENLQLGKEKFNTFCSPCHGYLAEGDSRLRGQFPNPPTLHSEKLRTWSDGRIYHVIEVGQNIMPSYSRQLTNKEKWATILYIRALQRSLNAKESDLQ